MNGLRGWVFIVVLLTGASRVPTTRAFQRQDAALAFLTMNFSLRDAELRALEQYRSVSRTLDASDDREVATLA